MSNNSKNCETVYLLERIKSNTKNCPYGYTKGEQIYSDCSRLPGWRKIAVIRVRNTY